MDFSQVVSAIVRSLFTQWSRGRLKPVPFAVAFTISALAIYLSSVAYFDAVANPITADRRGAVSAAQPLSFLPFGLSKLWLATTTLIIFTAAAANVMAKRIRDMGLPGGLAVSMLAIMMVVLLGGGSTLTWITTGFVLAVLLALLMVPTDRLEAGSGLSKPGDEGR